MFFIDEYLRIRGNQSLDEYLTEVESDQELDSDSKNEKLKSLVKGALKKDILTSGVYKYRLEELKKIGIVIRKKFPKEVFKWFQNDLIYKLWLKNKDREFYQKFNNLLEEFKNGPKDDKAIKKAGQLLNRNLKWFYPSAKNNEMEIEIFTDKLKRLYYLSQKKSDSAKESKITLRKNLQNQIIRILFGGLPHSIRWSSQMLFLEPPLTYSEPPMDESKRDIADWTKTFHQLQKEIENRPESEQFRILGQWINNMRIPLTSLPLNKKQIEKVAPYLTYLELNKVNYYPENWTSKWSINDMQDLISNIAQQLVYLKFDGNITLPTYMPSLETLVCNDYQEMLPADMPKLKTLICTNCSKLCTPIFQNNPPLDSLESMEIINCHQSKEMIVSDLKKLKHLKLCNIGNLGYISFLPKLESLDCRNCVNLQSIRRVPKLKSLNIKNCPKVVLDTPQTCRYSELKSSENDDGQ